MISEIVSGLDKKFEGRINTLYTFSASALGLLAVVSGGQPPLTILSAASKVYLGTAIPWFDSAQIWIGDRSWLTPALCVPLVAISTIAIVLQGLNALQSRSAATLWILVALAVSRGTNSIMLLLVILAIVVCGGVIKQRTDETGFVPAESVIIGLIDAPIRLVGWLWGYIKREDDTQDVRIVDHVRIRPPSGARVV